MNPTRVEAWRCSKCGRMYGKVPDNPESNPKEFAEDCCKCSKCGRSDEKYLLQGMCRSCGQKACVERYKNAEAKPVDPNEPLVYSEALDKYFNFDELADVWHDHLCDDLGYSDDEVEAEELPIKNILTALRVYTCNANKPHWPGIADIWSDYLPVDSDDGPPGDYEKVDDVMYEYLKNCGPWSYVSSNKKWNGELTKQT